MKRAIVFDCDGVLFDSKESNINFYNTLLKSFNLPLLKPEDIEYIHSHTADECIQHLFSHTPYFEDAKRLRWEIPMEQFIYQMKIEPGLTELLSYLKPSFYLAIATNRTNTIGEVLRLHRLSDYFDLVV